MIIRIVFSCTVLMFISCSNKTGEEKRTKKTSTNVDHSKQPIPQINSGTSLCNTAILNARADIYNHEIKYYFIGMTFPPKEVLTKLKAFEVSIIAKDCIISEEYTCYNGIIDSYLYYRHNYSVMK